MVVPRELIQFEASAEFKRRIEADAARLNLSIAAYFEYLHTPSSAGVEHERFDKVVDQVFGRFGQTMRNLAK